MLTVLQRPEWQIKILRIQGATPMLCISTDRFNDSQCYIYVLHKQPPAAA